MVIISQDKRNIINFDNISIIEINNSEFTDEKFEIEVIDVDSNQEIVGIYETIERAEEVLQEIASAYSDFNYYKSIVDSKEQIEKGIKIYRNYRTLDVYEMPKE